MNKTNTSKVLLALAALGACSSAFAVELVYESFNYANGTNFNTTTAATGTGLSGNYTTTRTVANSGATNVTSSGLTYGDLVVGGNKLNMDYNGFGGNETVAATLSAGNQTTLSASGANYWVSFLVQTPATFTNNQGMSLAADRGNAFDYWGFRALGTSSTTANWSVSVGTATFSSGAALSASTTYLVVLNAVRDAATQNWTTNGWVQTGGSIAATSGALGAAQQTATGSVGTTNAIQFLYMKSLANGSPVANPFNFDEIRIGATYLDVVPSAIPEPGSFAALAGLGVLGVALSRRRRSA